MFKAFPDGPGRWVRRTCGGGLGNGVFGHTCQGMGSMIPRIPVKGSGLQ